MKVLSVVIPCYNEQEAVPLFYREICKTAASMTAAVSFEFIFVDDGSNDETVSVVKALREQDQRVKFVSFSRNFGKEAAMYAGLQKAKGDFVVIMDADLQDPPGLLPDMLSALENEGYD